MTPFIPMGLLTTQQPPQKWCWHCSNAGIGGPQNHDSVEHEALWQESCRREMDARERMENKRKHAEWLKAPPEWNPI